MKPLQPAHPFDYYNGAPATALTALAPAVWLTMVWVLMVGMFWAVGYLSEDCPADAWSKAIADVAQHEVDFPARRSALAFSGATLVITAMLATTSAFWCFIAWSDKDPAYRRSIVMAVSIVFAVTLGIALLTVDGPLMPFTSRAGQALLALAAKSLRAPLADHVPKLMLGLSCVVPSVLLAGASLLLQPMASLSGQPYVRDQVRILTGRLRELDQMLYIGALTLVFGTLQLSSGLSVALSSMPKAADVKLKADLCKALAPAAGSSWAWARSGEQQRQHEVTGDATLTVFNEQCQALRVQFTRLESADSLRQLVKGVTLCFGLSFSALLAAIYVPSLLVLRNMVEPRLHVLDPADKPLAAVADPISKLGAVVATLSPLFAGLLANTLAGG